MEDFVQRVFEKEPLHVKRGPSAGPEYYSALGELASPEGLLSLLEGGMDMSRVRAVRCSDGSRTETPEEPPSLAEDVRRLFAEDWSLQWSQPQQEHDALAYLVSVLESMFGCLVGVTAYLTPPGTQGLAPHWDDADAFVLQLAGSTSWLLHSSSTASPLPPEAQTLPRMGSGDLELGALAPAMMELELRTGDLLYFPRGIIHHASNNEGEPSVHLTISAFQRQSLFDLSNRALEEAMVGLWEEDAAMRRALPWGAASLGSTSYAGICSSLAAALRRLANAVENESAAAAAQPAAGFHACGFVGTALADLNADFVRHRLPTRPAAPPEHAHPITPASSVAVVDPSVLALVPAKGQSGGFVLLHCLFNSQAEHMMPHDEGARVGEGSEKSEGEPEEEGDGHVEADKEEGEAAGEAREKGCITVSEAAARALGALCSSSAGRPLAGPGGGEARGEQLEAVLLRAGTPREAWPEVCSLLKQLATIGLVRVYPANGRAQDNGQAQPNPQVRQASSNGPQAAFAAEGPASRRRRQRGGRKHRESDAARGSGGAEPPQQLNSAEVPQQQNWWSRGETGPAVRSTGTSWRAATWQNPWLQGQAGGNFRTT